MIRRVRRRADEAPLNAKRLYRLMAKHGLLLQRHGDGDGDGGRGRGRGRLHRGEARDAAIERALVPGRSPIHLLERRGRACRLGLSIATTAK